MNWTPLAGTALGALIGVGSTLLADRVRWQCVPISNAVTAHPDAQV